MADSIDLLEAARTTGLRGLLHGINATDARDALGRFVAEIDRLRALSPAGGDLHHAVWSMVRPYIQPAAREKVNAALKETLAASPQQEPGAMTAESLAATWRARADDLADEMIPGTSNKEITLLRDLADELEAELVPTTADESGADGTLFAGSRGKYLYLPGVSIKSAAPPKSGAVPFDVLSIASEMEAACPHYAGPDVDYSVDASKVHTWAQALRATQPATSAGTTGDDSEDAARFAWYFSPGRESGDALVDLMMRSINNDEPSLDEWREAIDDARRAREVGNG